MGIISSKFVIDLQIAIFVIIILALSAVLYNIWVSSLNGKHAGYTSYLVAAGVLFTLGGLALVFWQAALAALIAFIPTGIPMIIGEALRNKRREHQAITRDRAQAERDAEEA